MKKMFAMLLALVMALSLLTCLTACGDEGTQDNDSSSQPTGDSNGDSTDADKDDANTDSGKNDTAKVSSFTLQGVRFSVVGDFEENLSPSGEAMFLKGDSFSITVNYNGTTSHANSEEATKSNYSSTQKYHTEATLELLETEDGVYYYTAKGLEGRSDQVFVDYVHEGIQWSFSTNSFTDEAIYAITHIQFG